MLFQRSGGPRSKPVFATLKARVLGAVFRAGLFVLRGQTILGDMRMMRAIPIAKLRIHEIRDASDIAYRRVGLLHFTVMHKPRPATVAWSSRSAYHSFVRANEMWPVSTRVNKLENADPSLPNCTGLPIQRLSTSRTTERRETVGSVLSIRGCYPSVSASAYVRICCIAKAALRDKCLAIVI